MILAMAYLAAGASDGIPELPGLWSLTPWGLVLGTLALVLVSVIRGWFIPKSTHERELAQAELRIDAQRLRGDEYKAAAVDKDRVIAEKDKQITALMEVGFVVRDVLRATVPGITLEDTTPTREGE